MDFQKENERDGSIDKYKATLVAKGYKQNEGLHYFDSYSPARGSTSIHMLVVIVVLNGLNMYIKWMLKWIFFYSELDKDIYLKQSEGFVAQGQEKKCVDLINHFIN